MDEYPEPDDALALPTVRTIAAIIGAIALAGVLGLTFLGGQVTSILSSVGNSINSGAIEDESGNTTGTTDPTDPDGKDNPIVDPAAAAPDLLIIRTGHIELEVDDVDTAVATARTRIAAVGGYVSASDESAAGDEPTAAVTFRIPADRWDEAIAALRGVASEVRHLQVATQAVTNQVVDLGARITNLRTTEAALQAIMAQATKIPDVLEVQSKLTEVRGEIERLTAQKASLKEQAAYGTLSVAFVLPVTPVVEEVRAGWDPAADADAAAGTLIKIGQRATTAGIWFAIVVLPIVVVLLTVVAIAVVSVKLTRRAQRASES
jgi:Domain of unknown function (DUF4349)